MQKEYITKNRAKQFVCGHCNEVCSEKPCESSDCDWMAIDTPYCPNCGALMDKEEPNEL